jgi:DNA polymerase-3 subunit epsilon
VSFPCIAFDTETTHPEPDEARIVTAYLGAVRPDGSVAYEREWLVRPDGWSIPDEAVAIHGITTEHALESGRPLNEVLGELLGAIHEECFGKSVPLVGQNLQYDLTLLDREMRRVGRGTIEGLVSGVYVLDSLVIDKAIDKYRRGSRKLIDMAAHYDVVLAEEDAHDARSDAVTAARILQAIARRPTAISHLSLPQLHERQVGWKAEQAAGLQDYFRRKAPAEKRDPNAVVRGEWPYIPMKAAA